MENFWSLLKRAIKGTYVSVEPFHLFRYLDEETFRYNERSATDAQRFALVLSSIAGKRLTYDRLTAQEVGSNVKTQRQGRGKKPATKATKTARIPSIR